MSRSYNSNTRGGGRTTRSNPQHRTPQTNPSNLSNGPYEHINSNPAPSSSSNPPADPPGWQSRGSYQVYVPKPDKREKVVGGARKEEERYQRHCEQKRLKRVSEPPRRTGGHMSEEEARKKQEADERRRKIQLREKREQAAKEKKEKEQKEIDVKKQKQREIAERNEMKEEERQRERDADRRRSNEAFLQRFQNTSGRQVQSDLPYEDERNFEDELDELMEMFPQCSLAYLSDVRQQTRTQEEAIHFLRASPF